MNGVKRHHTMQNDIKLKMEYLATCKFQGKKILIYRGTFEVEL